MRMKSFQELDNYFLFNEMGGYECDHKEVKKQPLEKKVSRIKENEYVMNKESKEIISNENENSFRLFMKMTRQEKMNFLKSAGIKLSISLSKCDVNEKTGVINTGIINPFTGTAIKIRVSDSSMDLSKKCREKYRINLALNKTVTDPERIFNHRITVIEKVKHHTENYSAIPVKLRRNQEKARAMAVVNSKVVTVQNKEARELIDYALLERINKISEKNKIYFNDFIALHSKNACLMHKHNLEEIRALVFVYTKYGKVKPMLVPAAYCHTCGHFILEKWVYEELCEKGIVLCQVIKETYCYNKNRNDYFSQLSPESILHECGYNVSATEDLSSAQRQKLLELIIDSGICTKNKVVSHISWLIDKRKGMKNQQNAVSKWEEDRRHIAKYKMGNSRVVGIRLIRERVAKEVS